jgi:protein-tyrosine phosphatase
LIDLHCHLLPGLDDGAANIGVALEMARIAVDDGIKTTVCTPHILPGVYSNSGEGISRAVAMLAAELERRRIPLQLVVGADIHLAPDLLTALGSGSAPTLGNTRYFLLEPPHHVVPPRLFDFAFSALTSGFVPILTHPERLSWIEQKYSQIQRLSAGGVLMQITAGSLLGKFGSAPRFWAERMLEEGLVDVMASDAHDARRRRPRLAEARDAVSKRTDDATAWRIVALTPQRILEDVVPSKLRQP